MAAHRIGIIGGSGLYHIEGFTRQKWVKLKTQAGEGYVPEEHVRSPLEYRACFINRGARWRMTAFEVGE